MTHIETYNANCQNYPMLLQAAEVLMKPPATIIGRDINELRKGLRNPEKANIVLLGDAGSGKTAFVQGFAYDKESLPYYLVLEVNPEKLMANSPDKDAAMLLGFRQLIDEVREYSQAHNVIVILFIDEFHKIAMFSPSLMESLKPMLEKSALNGFRLIASTTFEEYNTWIAVNRALDQRFLQMKLAELSKKVVKKILKGRAKQHGVEHLLSPSILEDIYVESKRLLISNSQPRASIDILNSMIGETVKSEEMVDGKLVKTFYTPEELNLPSEHSISHPLLKRVIQRTHGVDIDNEVNVVEVITALKTRLFNQEQAIDVVVSYLEMAAHSFNEIDRPKISFLSTGSTGTGKGLPDDELIPVANRDTLYKRNGDLKEGDLVFNRGGRVVKVTGVYPQGEKTCYKVELEDGRSIVCDEDHLWTYKEKRDTVWTTSNIREIAEDVHREGTDGEIYPRYFIPMNRAVRRPERHYEIKPYKAGKIALERGYIDDEYKVGSITQRWSIIQSLFDKGGEVNDDMSLTLMVHTQQLALDVQEILWSLGISSEIEPAGAISRVCVDIRREDKGHFFFLNKELKARACDYDESVPEKDYDLVGITEITKLDEKMSTTCIMVDDDDHLYQASKQHIVTHNTELAKIIAETMRLPLQRFDMSRYSRSEDAGAFADDLFRAVWSTPNAYILIDEVEKSSREAMNILLQVLDDARLTDSVNSDRVASFSGSIINLTTNLATEIYQNMHKHRGSSAEMDTELIYKSLADSEIFETAVLGRIDAIVPFRALPPEALEKIARRTLQDIIDAAETKDRRIIVSPDIIPYIVKDRTSNDTERGGARDTKRNIKTLVVRALAHYMTYEQKEVPIMLYLKGRPRFKYPEIADPLNAQIELKPCHSRDDIAKLIDQLSEKVGKPLVDKGIFIPSGEDLTPYVHQIVNLSQKGYNKFITEIDGEIVTVKGVNS